VRPGSFSCGCPVTIDATVTFDADDFIVCPAHGRRAYGWRTVLPHDPPPDSRCGWEKRKRDRRLLLETVGLNDPDPLFAA
jgi:hypothetical protein